MKRVNCYGKENKQRLVEKYYIKPVLYIGLLADQEKEGCCGKLKERYYVLKATEKQATKNEFSFYAGKHCAEEILKLINVSPLPYFNPFKSIGDNVRGGTTNPSKSNNQKVNPTNKELINAIYVISMAWNYPPPSYSSS